MYCGKCGRELRDGEKCGCQIQIRQYPLMQGNDTEKKGWNLFLTLSILFSVLSLAAFLLMRYLIAPSQEAGKTGIMLTYVIPAVMDLTACVMAMIALKDRQLWLKSGMLCLTGVLLGCVFSVLLLRYPQSHAERFSMESTEVVETNGSSEISRIAAEYQEGRMSYAAIRKALEGFNDEELAEAGADLVKRLEDDLKETIRQYADAKQYAKAYEELNKILTELPNDATALDLQQSYSEECLRYLKEESESLMEQGKEAEAREILEDAKEYYPKEEEVSDLLDDLDEMAAETETKSLRHEYEAVMADVSWTEAKLLAEERGGHLVTISDAQEQKLVEDLIDEYEDLHTVWIGGKNMNNGYQWVNGEEFSYTNWGPGEPNNETGDEIYMDMYEKDDIWYWNDVPNDISQYYSGKMGYVIEWELEE